jgi:hypothetical protein
MNRYVRMAGATLLLVSVEAATMLGQPFVERHAFHRLSPFPDKNHGLLFSTISNA